jgi:hypothetical protein
LECNSVVAGQTLPHVRARSTHAATPRAHTWT